MHTSCNRYRRNTNIQYAALHACKFLIRGSLNETPDILLFYLAPTMVGMAVFSSWLKMKSNFAQMTNYIY